MRFEASQAGVFSCDSIDGSYVFEKAFRPFDSFARDCNLFKDDDGSTYFIAAANDNYDMILYKLTSDYLDVAEEYKLNAYISLHKEALVIFKRKNLYYLITSGATGWDPNQQTYSTATIVTVT